jgi:quercetin dioxygenase-like cupin family protein
MAQDVRMSLSVVAEEQVPWTAHPRFSDILMKPMLTSAANPLASVSRVRVPPGGVIGWHQHATQTETVYVLGGNSTLTLDETPAPFGAGQIVAIPPTIRHTLVNEGAEPVELLCFFTPPVV